MIYFHFIYDVRPNFLKLTSAYVHNKIRYYTIIDVLQYNILKPVKNDFFINKSQQFFFLT